MLFRAIPANPVPRVISTSTTITGRDIASPDYTHWVIDTAGRTLTLPTPIKDLAGKFQGIVNTSNGICTLSGAFAGGASSAVMESKDACLLVCMPTASNTYKWIAIGLSSPLTGITETIQDVIGGMVSGNTETNIAVTYDDSAGKLNFVVSGVETVDSLGTLISGASAKATPIDADIVGFVDTEDTNDVKRATWTNVKAFLKTYFDTLYTAAAHATATTGVHGVGAGTIAKTADIPSKAAGSDITTGTDDAKFLTAKSLVDAGVPNTTTAVATFSGTLGWSGGAPTVTSEIYRQQTVNKRCNWGFDVAGSNGANATTMTLTFPAGLVPADVDMIVPTRVFVSVNGAAYSQVVATLDCADNTAGNRKLTVTTGTLTTGQAFRIIGNGAHEIA